MPTFPENAPGRRRGLLVPALFTLVGVALLIGLGVWQLERKAWKETLIDAIARRMNAPPLPLPPPQRWAALDAAHDQFTRVTFRATFENDQEALVFAGAAAMRPDTSGTSYWVFTPARLADGARVVVNRGFVPEANKDPATRAAGLVKRHAPVCNLGRDCDLPLSFYSSCGLASRRKTGRSVVGGGVGTW